MFLMSELRDGEYGALMNQESFQSGDFFKKKKKIDIGGKTNRLLIMGRNHANQLINTRNNNMKCRNDAKQFINQLATEEWK